MTQHPNGDYVEDIEFSNVYEDEEYGACALGEEDQRTIHRLIQTASKHITVDWSAVRKELGL